MLKWAQFRLTKTDRNVDFSLDLKIRFTENFYIQFSEDFENSISGASKF